MRRRRRVVLAVMLAGVVVAPSTPATSARLEIIAPNGSVMWGEALRTGESFELAFTHSSERCRWTQHYVAAAPGWIRQTRSTFPCFGAGMPADSMDGSPIRRSSDGYEVAAPLALGDLRMMNWQPAEITLRLHGREWPIGRWFPDYARFTVRIR